MVIVAEMMTTDGKSSAAYKMAERMIAFFDALASASDEILFRSDLPEAEAGSEK